MPTIELPVQNVRLRFETDPTALVGGLSSLSTRSEDTYVEVRPDNAFSIGGSVPDTAENLVGFGLATLPGGMTLADIKPDWTVNLLTKGFRTGGGAVGPDYVDDGYEGYQILPVPTVYPVTSLDVSGWSFAQQATVGDLPIGEYAETTHPIYNRGYIFGTSFVWDPSVTGGPTPDTGSQGLAPAMALVNYPFPGGPAASVRICYLALRITYSRKSRWQPAPPAQLSGRADGLGPMGGPPRLDTAAPSRQSGFHPGGYY